ncbi:hypothetical protein EPN81_03445 [Patescibacteria group bacterium]|nr:MAG: hypothetical protein EPN81_03445 [Patescibacteria group bacterium]
MVKNTRPVDSEKLLKQEVALPPSQTKESTRASGKESVLETGEIGVEQSMEITAGVDSGIGSVGEVPQEGQSVLRGRISSVEPKQIDRLEEEIEDILEEDLKELYVSMPSQTQAVFREKGEETRSKIRLLVRSAKVNAKKIFQLIRSWLKTIPGVNRFFLEQEAKIKTDKILFISEEEKKRNARL